MKTNVMLLALLTFTGCEPRSSLPYDAEAVKTDFVKCESLCKLVGMNVAGMDFRMSGTNSGYDYCRCEGRGGLTQ